MIKPTVGRVVWYRPEGPDGPTQAALVAFVHSDSMVNLAVFDNNGCHSSRTSVPLVHDGAPIPVGSYCEWMPYQKGQAAKTEAVEAELHAAKS